LAYGLKSLPFLSHPRELGTLVAVMRHVAENGTDMSKVRKEFGLA
jgi:hypothetical protein